MHYSWHNMIAISGIAILVITSMVCSAFFSDAAAKKQPGAFGDAFGTSAVEDRAASGGDEESQSLPQERHPVLLFGKDDITALRERVRREPYLAWWNSIKGSADKALEVGPGIITYEPTKTAYCKELAFAYVITGDEKYAHRAVEYFRAVKNRKDGGNWSTKFLAEQDGAVNLAQTYDMLYNYLRKHPDDDEYLRKWLYELGIHFYRYDPGWYFWHYNNHQSRHYSALSILAFVVADAHYKKPYPQEWYFKKAKEWVEKTFKYQTTNDGAWAEGHNYFQYSANIHLPYFFAAKRFLGIDYFNQPYVKALHEWSVKSRMPDGFRPNFDDASLSYYPTHYLTSAYKESGIFRWDWENFALKNWAGISAVDAICNYDDSVESLPPTWEPCQFFEQGGDLIFRSGWGSDAVYLIARAEHGKARKHGAGHEHPDETSFILYACGRILALDGGYVHWEERFKTCTSENHNLILVDGKGPVTGELVSAMKSVGSDARMKNTLSRKGFAYGEIHTEYHGAKFRRCFFFLDSRFFVVIDFISAPEPHQYTWLLHGNGGGTSGGKFELSKKAPAPEAVWEIGQSALHAYILTSEPKFEVRHRLDEHSSGYGQVLTHEVLEVEQECAEGIFAALLYPLNREEKCPEVKFDRNKEGLSINIRLADYLHLVEMDFGGARLLWRKYDGAGAEVDSFVQDKANNKK